MKKVANTKTKAFLNSNTQNFSEQMRKVEKIKTFGHSRASKNKKMPQFAHFPRPGESDPYVCHVLIKVHISILQLHHGGRGCSRRLEEVPWS